MIETIQELKDSRLDELKQKIISLNIEYNDSISQVRKNLNLAMRTRWEYGKIVYENMDYIMSTCGSQKHFAELVGDSEGVVSNNKRGYKYLLDEGCETWDDVLRLLKQKQIKPTVYNFERLGKLLNEPNAETPRTEQLDKDRKRLEQLRGEIEEILQRNEPGTKPELVEDAFEFLEDIDEISRYLDSFDPARTGWRSETYLNFVRNFGFDVVTGEPIERADPHHTDEYGGSGSTGDKLPDYYVIPVSRKTHTLLESGNLELSPREILQAQFKTLTAFLTLNLNK